MSCKFCLNKPRELLTLSWWIHTKFLTWEIIFLMKRDFYLISTRGHCLMVILKQKPRNGMNNKWSIVDFAFQWLIFHSWHFDIIVDTIYTHKHKRKWCHLLLGAVAWWTISILRNECTEIGTVARCQRWIEKIVLGHRI